MYYVYILRCRGDTLYTGITPDPVHRMRCHTGALPGGARYTRSHPPESLAALWRTEGKAEAARLEYAIKKKLTRQEKEQLIAAPGEVGALFPHLADADYIPIADITLTDCLKGAFHDAE